MFLTENGGRGVKTLGIRLEPDVHQQLTLIAQLRSSTITDEIKAALEAHIASAKDAPDLAAQADSALAAVEAEAAARREAISSLFGATTPKQADPAPATTASRSRGSKAE